MDLSACSTWHSRADSASAAATLPVAEAAMSATALSDAVNPSTGTAAVSANAATALSGVRAVDPSPGAVLAANAPSTLFAGGPSKGAASASADTAVLPSGFSTANFPTGTTFGSAGAETNPSVAGAVDLSTDAALATTSAAAPPTGANTTALAANASPAAPITDSTASSKSPSVVGYTAGTLGAMMHDRVQFDFTGQRALKQAQEWQTVLKLAQPKRQNAHDAPSCPLSKFITTEASQGGGIARTTPKITRQHDIVSFPQGMACRQILLSNGSWTSAEIEPAWENYSESQA